MLEGAPGTAEPGRASRCSRSASGPLPPAPYLWRVTGKLILCATPIGNLDDAPPRLAEVLRMADVVYAEDTRRSRTLTRHLGVNPKLRSFFSGNERQRVDEISEHLSNGATVALITDAGTPAVSDPGYLAVRGAIGVGATVSVVPGPSTVTAALAVAGLPVERFTFEGFLPRKQGERAARLDTIKERAETTIFFASPSRIGADLADIAAFDPQRPVVVAREMTKLHEEVWRGTAEAAAEHWQGRGRGEFTVVVAGAAPRDTDLEAATSEVLELVAGGASFATAVRDVAADQGVSRRRLYESALGRRSS